MPPSRLSAVSNVWIGLPPLTLYFRRSRIEPREPRYSWDAVGYREREREREIKQRRGGSRISILPVSTLLLASTAAMAMDAELRWISVSILKHCRILAWLCTLSLSLSLSLSPSSVLDSTLHLGQLFLPTCSLSLVADFHHVAVRQIFALARNVKLSRELYGHVNLPLLDVYALYKRVSFFHSRVEFGEQCCHRHSRCPAQYFRRAGSFNSKIDCHGVGGGCCGKV